MTQFIIGLVIGVAMGMFFLGLLQASKINGLYEEIEYWKERAKWVKTQDDDLISFESALRDNFTNIGLKRQTAFKNLKQKPKEG